MLRRLLASIALAAVPLFVIPTALVPVAGAAPSGPIQGCMNGGWRTITDVSGQPFKSQGQCIAYAIQHPVSLADLSGSFIGRSFAQTGCPLVQLRLDASYPGSSAVGTVALEMDGCVNIVSFPPVLFSFTGGFSIGTNVGTLRGTVAGQITTVQGGPSPPDFAIDTATLTLTATSGTGLFTGTTGMLNVSLQWYDPEDFVGTITSA